MDQELWTPPVTKKPSVLLDVGATFTQTGKPGKFDLTPFTDAVEAVVRAEKIIHKNPYDKGAMGMIVGASRDMRKFLAREMPADVGAVLRPIAHHIAGPMLEHARIGLQLRMHAEHKMIMHPTQSIGLTFSCPNGGTATTTIQNMYQGSGATGTFQNTLWAITGFESGALANTATAAGSLFVSSLIIAGHDYVGASRAAVVTGSTSGTGGGTIVNTTTGSGWGWYVWASDKRERPHTIFSPWNVQGASGIIGSIMRETGQVTVTFLNQTGGTVYVPFHVHVKASLCGGPFDVDHLTKMFVPFHKQLAAAHTMGQWMPQHFERAFSGENSNYHPKAIRGLEDGLEGLLNDELFQPL